MVGNIIEMIQYFLEVLDIDIEGHNIFIYYGISLVRKLTIATYEAYQYLVEKEHSKLSSMDREKLLFPKPGINMILARTLP